MICCIPNLNTILQLPLRLTLSRKALSGMTLEEQPFQRMRKPYNFEAIFIWNKSNQAQILCLIKILESNTNKSDSTGFSFKVPMKYSLMGV